MYGGCVLLDHGLLENIIEYRTKDTIIRSKSQWYNEAEKNSRFFLNLEKRYCKQGTKRQLKINATAFVITDRDILSECTAFYTKPLYVKKSWQPPVNIIFLSELHFFDQWRTNFVWRPLDSKGMFWSPEEHGVLQNARHGWASCRILQSLLERYFLFFNLGPQGLTLTAS